MKKFFYSMAFLTGIFAFSQVGVNTTNPQGTFHVDGAKDNPATGVPTPAQQANDFVVKPNGSVGIGTTTPHSSAVLDVYATHKGFLPPGLTTAQRDAIANPSTGLMIYNSEVNCMQYWNSRQWIATCSSGGTGTLSDCTSGALSGTYAQGTAMTSGNTVVLAVNATQTGPWTASSATVNGVSFSGSGTFTATGAQNITLTASGTPTAGGSFTYPFMLGASACSRSITFTSSLAVVLPGNTQPWLRHNLGADTSLDPDVPVQTIHGNYYQWGRATVVATTSTPSGAIAGWNTTTAPDGAWSDGSKTANDPCPSGFRVPTRQQFQNLLNNNTRSNVGTFTDSATNFGSAKVFTGGGNTLTLPAAGTRYYTDGTLSLRGFYGGYWSSNQRTATSGVYALYFLSNSLDVVSYTRANGFSVRCISE